MTRTGILEVAEVERAINTPFDLWAHNCHSVSYAIINAGLIDGRIARGWCRGVTSQHSWIVAGNDCYAPDAQIVDPTLWSYDNSVEGIWYGSARDGRHRPHGGESTIWQYGRPSDPTGRIIELPGMERLSGEAQFFLGMCGPLDREGWAFLAHCPVLGWPAGEIYDLMCDVPGLEVLIPVDRIGMLTDRNPNGIYLREKP